MVSLAAKLCGFVWAMLPGIAMAGWGFAGDQAQLQGYAIAEVGEVSKVDPPTNMEWREQVYQMNGRCFTLPNHYGYWGFGGKAGLLLVNDQKLVSLAIFESGIGSVDVKLHYVMLMQCPSGTNVIPYSADPQERLRLLREYQKQLEERQRDLQQRWDQMQKGR